MTRKYELPKQCLSDYSTRIIVAGSRSYTNYKQFVIFMDSYDRKFHEEHIYISGDASRGADAMLIHWCELRRKPYVTFPADWEKNKRIAGFLRNKEMADNATHLLAFYDGRSNGTRNMIWEAKKHHLVFEIVIFKPDEQPFERDLPHVLTHQKNSDRVGSTSGFSFRSTDDHQ